MSQTSKAARSIAPYRVRDSGRTVGEVIADINYRVHAGHGPDRRVRGGTLGVLNDPLFQYERLMRDLCAVPGLRCVPFRELLFMRPQAGEILCGIRHDIDIDIRTALELARLEAAYGVRSTWFVLHTAPYYGEFEHGVFKRHDAMRHVYRDLQDIGHEVALHTDPLHVYQMQGRDGAAAVQEEIGWLRAGGIDVVGTTAHNSKSVYGAENFAIFRGRRGSFSDPSPELRDEVEHEGRWAPLGVLDETDLGLIYEANDLFWQSEVPVAYAATRGVNLWRWNSESSVALAKVARGTRTHGFVSHEELIDRLAALPGAQYACLVVHPVYYGARHSAGAGPALRLSRQHERRGDALGWTTRVPWSLQAASGVHAGVQEYQSINMSDEDGMLDVAEPFDRTSAGQRVLVLGGANLDGASLGTAAHCHRLFGEALARSTNGPVWVRKLAHPEIGFARYFAWYRMVAARLAPNVVVLGIGADEALWSLPNHWAARTGYDPRHPPAAYLRLAADGAVEEVAASRLAALHEQRADPRSSAPSLADPDSAARAEAARALAACLGHFVAAIRHDGAVPVVLVQECGESAGMAWGDAEAADALAGAHARFMAWLAPLASTLGVVVADPYPAFLAHRGRARTHWLSDRRWSYVGHRIAARVLADAVGSALGLGAREPAAAGAVADSYP